MRAGILLGLIVAAVSVASGQYDPRVKEGARVRVTTGGAQLTGRVVWMEHPDTIVVDHADTLVAIALGDAQQLAVFGRSRGDDYLANTLGVLGAATGAGLYLRWCLRSLDACGALEEEWGSGDDDEEEGGSSVFGFVTVTSGFVGLLLGRALTPPRWRDLPVPVRLGMAPVRDGVAMYVSLPAPRFAVGR